MQWETIAMSNDKYEIRRLALKELVDSLGKGGIAIVADRIGKSPSYVSRMLYEPGKDGRKGIGEDSWDIITKEYPEISGNSPSPPIAGFATARDYTRLQLLEGGAGMGDGVVNEDYPEVIREVEISNTELRKKLGFLPAPGRIQLITGRGPSMYPDIEDGEVVAVDTQINFFDGDDFYLININGMTQIKQLQMRPDGLHVVSSNPRFHPYRVESPDEIAIGGKAILGLRVHRLGV